MEIDFSAQITAKNLNFVPKTLEFDGFKLSDKAVSMLEAKASKSGQNVETLKIVCENAVTAAKNFFRPSISDCQFVVARLNKFVNRGDAKLLTANHVDLSDMDFSMARVTSAEFKLSDSDFREVKAEVKVTVEQEDESEDGEECECEEETETEEIEGLVVCSKCGKKAKAKKSC